MKIFNNLCEGWRTYLRDVSLTGSTWLNKTSTPYTLTAFLKKRKEALTMSEFEKLHPLNCRCSNNELKVLEKMENWGFDKLNPMEKGIFLEGKVLEEEARMTSLPIKQGTQTILQEIINDKPLISFNVDGYIGEDILKTDMIYEVKTTSQNKSTAEKFLQYNSQIQFYIYSFPKAVNMILLLFYIPKGLYTRLQIEMCPTTKEQIDEAIKRVKSKM